jgi:hypothetical protein
MEFIQLGAQYGFPALLVCFLLWTQAARDKRRDTAADKTDEFIREILVDLVADSSKAIAANTQALATLAAALDHNTQHTDESAEKLDRLLQKFEHFTCPLREQNQ